MIGFEPSAIGVVIFALLTIPSVVFSLIFLPKANKIKKIKAESFYAVIEIVGLLGCAVTMILGGYGQKFDVTYMLAFFVVSIIAVFLYYGVWICFIINGQNEKLKYIPFLYVPLPMSVFFIIAIASFAVWGRNALLGIAITLFAVGNIAKSLLILKAFNNEIIKGDPTKTIADDNK